MTLKQNFNKLKKISYIKNMAGGLIFVFVFNFANNWCYKMQRLI